MGRKAIIKPGLSEVILESTSAPILALDRTYHIIYSNYSHAALNGVSFERLERRSFPDTFLPQKENVSWTETTCPHHFRRMRPTALCAQ
jgi:PAS domain-containing protein